MKTFNRIPAAIGAVVILAFIGAALFAPAFIARDNVPVKDDKYIIDSLEIELEKCQAEKAKLIKDFNLCYTYKNRAWADN